TSVTVTFNGPVDPETFTVADVVSITGPNGPITAGSVVDITPTPPAGQANKHNVYQINFPGQVLDGIYTFVIGPKISDFAGDQMDQNNNGINGEVPGDRFTGTFVINTTDNGRFLTGVYHDVLGRGADTSGFISLITPIEN